MELTTNQLLSLIVVVPSIVAIVRFRMIDPGFYPFLFVIFLGLLNECLSTYLQQQNVRIAPATNIYSLLEAGFVTWQFKNWNLFKKNATPKILIVSFICVWCIEIFFVSSINHYVSYYNIFYSFAIVLMSIQMMNKLLIMVTRKLLTNPIFLACAGFILFFTFAIMVEIFWMYGLSASKEFRLKVYDMLAYVNFIVNIVFTISILWMPTKQKFILQ
jgi:hypothetical protein